jgi:hypothetical protein
VVIAVTTGSYALLVPPALVVALFAVLMLVFSHRR